jgi:flagellar basal body-associated protein FliL
MSAAIGAAMILLAAVVVTAMLWLIDRNSESAQQQAQKARQMEAPVALEPVMKLPAVLEDHRMPDETSLLRDTLSQRSRQ